MRVVLLCKGHVKMSMFGYLLRKLIMLTTLQYKGLHGVVSLNKKLYPYSLVLVGSRNRIECDFTTKLK